MPFQPGQSGNPKGAPKSAKLFKQALTVELKKTQGDVELIQKVAQRLVENALNGETVAIKEIADRMDGKVPQAIVGDDEHDAISIIQRIERIIVKPQHPDSGSVPPAASAS